MDQLFEIADMFLGNKTKKETRLTGDKDAMEKYRGYLRNGEYFQMVFERADLNGNLSRVEDDILLIMGADGINGEAYDLRYKSQKLADSYCVQVVSIDEEGRTVHVSHNAARLDQRPQIEAEIVKRLKEKNMVRIKGKVIRIQSRIIEGQTVDTGVWLDLCGVGILGFVYIGDWAQTYTSALRGKVSYGDVVEVAVRERVEREQKKGKLVYYACSRKEFVENPWESKSLQEKYHTGDIVRIKCLSLHKGHWFGEINGLNDIQVFTEYPSPTRNFPIIPGMEYMGKIYYLNTRERSLKARVFEALTLEGFQEIHADPKESEEKGKEET